MLIRSVDHTLLRLYATLIILYISAGLSFLHPLFHEHPDDNVHPLNHYHNNYIEKLTEDEDHPCPLCDFLSVNQFYHGLSVDTCQVDQHFCKIKTTNTVLIVKSISGDADPRAPPFFSMAS